MQWSVGQYVAITLSYRQQGRIGVIVDKLDTNDPRELQYCVSVVGEPDRWLREDQFMVLQPDALNPENIPTRRKKHTLPRTHINT